MRLALVALVVVSTMTAFAAESLPNCSVVPGWAQSGAARSYAADNLYDYMDGNSEGYLVYGFREMRGVTCKAGEVSFVIDISQMNDSEAAWGLFASNRDPRLSTEAIGIAGQIVPQRGFFVKGSRFIEISASPSSADHTVALRAFLQALEVRVEGSTAPPAPVGWFPKEHLDPSSIRLIPESLLGISLLKKGYLAKYDYGRAFVVRQSSDGAASQAMAKLRERFGSAKTAQLADEGFEANDRYLGRLLIFRKGPYIAGFVNLTEGALCVEAANALSAAIPQESVR